MWKKVLLSVLHGVATLLILWWYININYVTEPEEKEIQYLNWFRLQTNHPDTQILNKTVLVNTAKELELIDDPEEYGKMAITDRKALARLFHAINIQPKPPGLIICDILFSERTDHDSSLENEIGLLPHFVTPYVLEAGLPVEPIFNKARSGLAQYYTHDEKMVKFQLIHPGSMKTLPLLADEWVNHRSYESTFLGTICSGRPVLGSIIPNYRIRPHMIQASGSPEENTQEEGPHPTVPLYTAHDLTILLGDSLRGAGFLDGKYVVIGNFSGQDLHRTPIGSMPGVLILYNTFLTLNEGRQFISPLWLIYITCAFALLSYLVFFKGFPHFHFTGSGILHYLTHSFLLKFISIAFFVSVVSFASYMIFHTHVNILFISFYYSLLSDIIKYWKDEKTVQHS